MDLEVVMPSKDRSGRSDFVVRAIQSVQDQVRHGFNNVSVILVLDPDDSFERSLDMFRIPISVVRSKVKGQIPALNTGVASAKSSHLAFLEDDDWWDDNFLQVSTECIVDCAPNLITQNQIEVEEDGSFMRVFDFPTPSTWVAETEMVRKLGGFDLQSRWHTDNWFLGEVQSKGFSRVHLVERTAPIALPLAEQVRPWIANIIKTNPKNFDIFAHQYPEPLVFRQVHASQGTETVSCEAKEESISEYRVLKQKFQCIPW
jgi:hypothetical protein